MTDDSDELCKYLKETHTQQHIHISSTLSSVKLNIFNKKNTKKNTKTEKQKKGATEDLQNYQNILTIRIKKS